MKAATFTVTGEVGEKTSLPEKLFGIKVDEKLLAQAVRVYLSNQRQGSAKTKTRSEVKKTTAKMYKQKGTGRARHGSYAAPIFVGGGIAHGPTGEQNYKLKMSAPLKRLAFLGGLTQKASESKVLVISDAEKASGKTREAEQVFTKSKVAGSILVIMSHSQVKFAREWKNLSRVTLAKPNQLNAYVVLQHKNLFITTEAIKEMEKIYVS